MEWDTPVTVFICNVAPSLSDTFIKRILEQLGKISSWRRALGVKNEPYDFMFVDFSQPIDVLRALRIIPHIVVLEKKWIAQVDKVVINDLEAFESSVQMKDDYDQAKENRKDQTILYMINQIIESSAFATVVERLTENLESKFDDDRTGEHYRYKRDIRNENDRYESIFRNIKNNWERTEKLYQSEMIEMEKSKVSSEERNNRESFLEQWQKPKFDISTSEAKTQYLKEWDEFMKIRAERKQIRQNEIKLEEIIQD